MSDKNSNSAPGSLHLALILFPVWLMLFYFRNTLSRWMLFEVFHLENQGIATTLAFFIATLLKIFLLLGLIVFVMSLVRSFVPSTKIKDRLRSMPPLQANVYAGILGIFTPFCSCSAVPLFIGFLETGIPLGITFTFLIASPLINEIILTMLAGLFGIKTALIYLLGGFVIAVGSGMLIDKLGMEKHLPEWLLQFRSERPQPAPKMDLNTRFSEAFRSVYSILSRNWLYVLAGVTIGAAIHGYVPDSLTRFLGSERFFAVPLAVLTGIPLYACSAAVAPVAFALVDKGLPLGTALAFIMAVAGLSLPELIMLRKVLSFKLIIVFIGVLFTGILIMGYLFNWIL